jgi:tetratricopeptide (TPR) repeat protein
MGDLMNAQLAFEDAIKINPKFVLALSNLGNIKKDLNNFKESIKIYNQALEIDKNNYTVLNNLGFVLQGMGRFEKAKQCFETSIKINPKNTRSHRLLGMSLKYDINNIHLKNMANLIKDQSLNDSQKIELYFALGKAYEDIKNYNKAYESYNLGNILKRKIIKYTINDDIKLFDNIKILILKIYMILVLIAKK